jgi:hypothetical protein
MTDRHLTDTSPDALRVMTALYARMTPEEKFRRVRDLTMAANQFALAGLRRRHPGETESELLLRLARIRLGADLVARAYPDSTATGAT